MSDSTVRLQSSDGEVFVVRLEVARMSRMLATMLDDLGHEPDDVIPLPNVTARLLKKVLGWIDHHLNKDLNTPAPPQTSPTTAPPFQPRLQSRVPQRPGQHPPSTAPSLSQWEKEFVKKNKDEIYELLLAANYLDIKPLLDILCQTVAGVIKGKDPEVIRRTFNASLPQTEPPSQAAHHHTEPQQLSHTSEPTDPSRQRKETSV